MSPTASTVANRGDLLGMMLWGERTGYYPDEVDPFTYLPIQGRSKRPRKGYPEVDPFEFNPIDNPFAGEEFAGLSVSVRIVPTRELREHLVFEFVVCPGSQHVCGTRRIVHWDAYLGLFERRFHRMEPSIVRPYRGVCSIAIFHGADWTTNQTELRVGSGHSNALL
jgi:hypothetical protein